MKKSDLTGNTSDFIKARLGYDLPIAMANSIDNLADVPQKILEEAAKVGILYAEELLKFYTTKQNWNFLKNYIEDVVYKNQDPKEWADDYKYLAPDLSLADQLCNSLTEILFYTEGKFDCIIKPDFQRWKSGDSNTGAPATSIPGANYLFIPPKNTSIYGEIEIIKIKSNLTFIAFRRWIAQRIAACLEDRLLTFNHIQELEDFAPVTNWTEDAKKAFYGLLREREEIGWKEGEIPGFVGPDAFYS